MPEDSVILQMEMEREMYETLLAITERYGVSIEELIIGVVSEKYIEDYLEARDTSGIH